MSTGSLPPSRTSKPCSEYFHWCTGPPSLGSRKSFPGNGLNPFTVIPPETLYLWDIHNSYGDIAARPIEQVRTQLRQLQSYLGSKRSQQLNGPLDRPGGPGLIGACAVTYWGRGRAGWASRWGTFALCISEISGRWAGRPEFRRAVSRSDYGQQMDDGQIRRRASANIIFRRLTTHGTNITSSHSQNAGLSPAYRCQYIPGSRPRCNSGNSGEPERSECSRGARYHQ